MRISRKIVLVFFLSFCFASCQPASGGNIVIYGDSQNNPGVQRSLVRKILSFKPVAVFRVGDLVDNGNDPDLWKAFKDIHGPLLKGAEYFPALGNHENDSPLYFENFPALHGQRWYSADREGIHFVVLDSNSKLEPGSTQYEWLEADLAGPGAKAKFIVVLFHHPLFDVGWHPSDERDLKPILLPLFKRYGVSAVFSGHSHDYQHFEYDGIYFVVTGGGGSSLVGQVRENIYLKKFKLVYHFCLLTPSQDSLRVRVLDIRSHKIDDFKIPKRRAGR